ncbi:hypothetical protein P0Y35_11740 [Kiritimatiellaeota bacterium B1221]|nr:hypothetical protein [Kiritimatiellaeota bacterium B1221]
MKLVLDNGKEVKLEIENTNNMIGVGIDLPSSKLNGAKIILDDGREVDVNKGPKASPCKFNK